MMVKSIGRGFVVLFLLFAVSCSNTPGYRINGIIEGHKGFPVAGTMVDAPGCGRVRVESDNGFFTLHCDVGANPQVIVVSQDGYAPAIRVLQPDAGVTYSLFIPIGMKITSQDFDVQSEDQPMNASILGFSITSDASVFGLRGKASVSLAYWDPLLQHKAIKPFFGGFLDENGKHLKALPIAIGYVSVTQNGNQVDVLPGNKFEATLTGVDLHNTNFNSWSDTDKLFYFDQKRGVFVEKPFLAVDPTTFAMRFTADATGFWMWAKPFIHPSCMQVELDFPNGKGAAGAQVDLEQTYFTEQTLDTGSGTACIDSESGYVDDIIGTIVTPTHVLTARRDMLTFPTKPGSCETGCPGHVTLTFQCTDDTDCLKGYTCQGGACKK